LNQVICFVADQNYFDHAKYVLVNCKRQGGWKGDFCIITPGGGASDFQHRGIHVYEVKGSWDFMVKFHAFTPFFHRWDECLLLDLDIVVQGPLQKVFDGLRSRLPKLLANQEDGDTLSALKHWDEKREEHTDAYLRVQELYPHVTNKMFNMAILFFRPKSLPPDTQERLRQLHEEFKEINPTCADQMLVNLLLYDQLEEAGKDYWTFMGNDWPCNRVKSVGRGWRGDEEPVILHYTRWMAPWIVKYPPEGDALKGLLALGLPPETGGYRNHRLNVVCHEFYAECVKAFNEEFPIV